MDHVLTKRSTAPPRRGHLPDFDSPPIVETVLSVQFEPLPLLNTAHLGLLWNEYRLTFPKSEDRPPLQPVVEQFPESPVARVGLKLQALETSPHLESGSQTIQAK